MTLIVFLVPGSSTLDGLHTGENGLQKLMLILQQTSWERFCRGMALWFFMYVKGLFTHYLQLFVQTYDIAIEIFQMAHGGTNFGCTHSPTSED